MSENKTILESEKEILKNEQAILNEVKNERAEIKKIERTALFVIIGVFLAVVAIGGGLMYWHYASGHLFIDTAQIVAPEIQLGPDSPGVLEQVMVQEGDTVLPNTVVARVGNELIKTTVGGLIISVNKDIGRRFNPGDAVVTMIHPEDLRVVAQLEEDKGLDRVRVGQSVIFTVDTFGSKQYYGTVDEISPSSHQSDIVFNISDQRQSQDFDIKVRFDTTAYPELKNGMSAKITILTN